MPPALVGNEAGEYEDGLDTQFLKCTQVSLDTLHQSKRKTAGSGEKRFSRRWVIIEALKVVRCVDTESRVGKDAQRQRLEVFPLRKIVCKFLGQFWA